MAKNHGDTFKVALSISGVALEQLEVHAPGVIELLHQLNETGCCEFLCEPYSHGLSSLANEDCFREEVERMRTKIKQIFGKEPKVFRNSSLIYSNDIARTRKRLRYLPSISIRAMRKRHCLSACKG